MNWNLNTALQLNPHQYLAVFNRQKQTQIDVFHHPNNSTTTTIFSKFLNQCDVNNYATRSVNSVQTPLTQYQLYEIPSVDSLEEQTNSSNTLKVNDFTNLYPGKRFLNLDLPLHNVTSFTDTIFNLPTPSDDLIPIISLTEGTPTTPCSKTINDIEDLNKLRPPITSSILNNMLNMTEKPTNKKPDIPKKPAMLSSILNETHAKKSIATRTTKADLKATHPRTDATANQIASKAFDMTSDSNLKETSDDTLTAILNKDIRENESLNTNSTFENKNFEDILNLTTTGVSPDTINSNSNDISANVVKPSIETTITSIGIKEITGSVVNTTTDENNTPTHTASNWNLDPNLRPMQALERDAIFTTTTETSLITPTILDSNPEEASREVVDLSSPTSTIPTRAATISQRTATTNSILNQFNPRPITAFTDIDLITVRPINTTLNTSTNTKRITIGTKTTPDAFLNKSATILLQAITEQDSNDSDISAEVLKPTTTISNATLDINVIAIETTTKASSARANFTKTVQSSSFYNSSINVAPIFTRNENKIEIENDTDTDADTDTEIETVEANNRILQQKLVENSVSKEDSMSSFLSTDSNETSESTRQPSSDSEGSLPIDLK